MHWAEILFSFHYSEVKCNFWKQMISIVLKPQSEIRNVKCGICDLWPQFCEQIAKNTMFPLFNAGFL